MGGISTPSHLPVEGGAPVRLDAGTIRRYELRGMADDRGLGGEPANR